MAEQHDDHIWLKVMGEDWAIRAIDHQNSIFYLWRGYHPDFEFLDVQIINVDWNAYCEAAVGMLRE
jgi:hypothetical protein